MPALAVVLTALAVLGAVVAVTVALRSGRAGGPARRSATAERGLLRITASVHTGWEQTVLGLIREIGLPLEPTDLSYGRLYLQRVTEERTLIRSRSEIGRGFLGAIDITPARGATRVQYAILRLPGDDRINTAVLDLELRLVTALRRVDAHVDLQLSADALRNLDGVRPSPESPADGANG
jgi:hypothetical protein